MTSSKPRWYALLDKACGMTFDWCNLQACIRNIPNTTRSRPFPRNIVAFETADNGIARRVEDWRI
jgi:hypothetical protein